MSENNRAIMPFMTFRDNAEEAVNFYISVFPDSKLLSIFKYSANDRVEEGKITNAHFELMGNEFMAMDIGNEYGVDFSWAISLFINTRSQEEFDNLFKSLSEKGFVMMGPEPVLDLKSVAWVTDKFGVTWQLVLK